MTVVESQSKYITVYTVQSCGMLALQMTVLFKLLLLQLLQYLRKTRFLYKQDLFESNSTSWYLLLVRQIDISEQKLSGASTEDK